jgi:hypothetical protein
MKKGHHMNSGFRHEPAHGKNHRSVFDELEFGKKVLYDEYRNMFNDEDWLEDMPGVKTDFRLYDIKWIMNNIDIDTFDLRSNLNKSRIVSLHIDRITSNERNFIVVVPKNNFERLDVWCPTTFYGKVGWVFMYFGYLIKSRAEIIIKNPAFEATTIMVILVNSVLLAMRDPAATEEQPWENTFEHIFLGLYSIEMVLKILGMGFVLGSDTYLRDSWNILDFIIVTTAYIPIIFASGAGFSLSSLRS